MNFWLRQKYQEALRRDLLSVSTLLRIRSIQLGLRVYRKRLRYIVLFVPILLSERTKKLKRSISKLYQTIVIVSNHAGLRRFEVTGRYIEFRFEGGRKIGGRRKSHFRGYLRNRLIRIQ